MIAEQNENKKMDSAERSVLLILGLPALSFFRVLRLQRDVLWAWRESRREARQRTR